MAAPDLTNSFNTMLTPEEEKQFKSAFPDARDLFDYDLRGYWKKHGGKRGQGHLTDEFKKPNHPTFSMESKYSKPGLMGGAWRQNSDGTWSFFASPLNIQIHGSEELKNYFNRVEPGNFLITPPYTGGTSR